MLKLCCSHDTADNLFIFHHHRPHAPDSGSASEKARTSLILPAEGHLNPVQDGTCTALTLVNPLDVTYQEKGSSWSSEGVKNGVQGVNMRGA